MLCKSLKRLKLDSGFFPRKMLSNRFGSSHDAYIPTGYIDPMSREGPQIKNEDVPICAECIHYKDVAGKPWASMCTKFGIRDIITGLVEFETAKNSRLYGYMCGNKGTFFKPKSE